MSDERSAEERLRRRMRRKGLVPFVIDGVTGRVLVWANVRH